MLQIVIAGVLAYGIIKLIEKIQKRNDFVATGGIVGATILLVFLANFAIKLLKWPEWYSLFLLPVYFLFPLFVLRGMWELSWGRSSAYAGIIFGSIIFAEFGLYFLLSALSYR